MTLNPLKASAFRQALMFGALFTLGSSLLLGGIYLMTRSMTLNEADAIILAEQQGLLDLFAREGESGLLAELQSRRDDWGRSGGVFLLADSAQQRLAGNLDRWPFEGVPQAAWPEFEIISRRDSGATPSPVRAALLRLADGNLLLVGTDLTDQRRFLQRFRDATFWGIGLLALLSTVGGSVLAWRMSGRVRTAAATCELIVAGDLSQRLPVHRSGDELDALSAGVNRVLARLEDSTALLRTSFSSTAHDLRAPLQRLRARIESLHGANEVPPGRRELIDAALRDLDRVQRTLSTLLQIAQLEAGIPSARFTAVDLAAVTAELLELYAPVAAERGLQLQALTHRGACIVHGQRQLLSQLLINLFENALTYVPPGGRVTVDLDAGPDGVCLLVSDDGPGIAEADRERALLPFSRLGHADHRADAAGEGSGLGLALVASIARLHRAELSLEDNAPGLSVRLKFPPVAENRGS